jgi:hypothetical protein
MQGTDTNVSKLHHQGLVRGNAQPCVNRQVDLALRYGLNLKPDKTFFVKSKQAASEAQRGSLTSGYRTA